MGKNRPDDFYTPKYALEPLIKYIPKKSILWECAAGIENMMVNNLREFGYSTIGTTIEDGFDFLEFDPYEDVEGFEFDIIITNPPFTIKDKFIERCYYFYEHYNKPFALLMPITALEGSKRMNMYRSNGLQLIMPPGRINYKTPVKKLEEGKGSSAFFYSAWFTWGLNLPNDINFENKWSKN